VRCIGRPDCYDPRIAAPRSGRRLPRLSLTLLGGFDARVGPGDRLALPRRKAEALLAYLALSPDGAGPRERLMALLWPDVSAVQAGNSHLRK
jgi:DNA-binding SARP family transcriptional activator